MKFIFLALVLSSLCFAEEPTRVDITAEHLEDETKTQSSTWVDIEEIKTHGNQSVEEILRRLPSLTVLSSGATSNVSIRGASAEHTLVAIDGFIVNDPLHPTRSFDFSKLSLSQIKSIRVLRGPEAVRYGSDAVSGVIEITTLSGEGPRQWRAMGEYGSFDSKKFEFGVSEQRERLDYTTAVSIEGSDGISSADAGLGNSEKDKKTKISLAAKVGADLSADLRATASARFHDAHLDMDDRGGPGGDDPNDSSREKSLLTQFQFEKAKNSDWQPKLKYSALFLKRSSDKQPDALHPQSNQSLFESRRLKIAQENRFFFNEIHSADLGLEAIREEGDSFENFSGVESKQEGLKQESLGVFFSDQLEFSQFLLNSGARLDYSKDFKDEASINFSPGWRIPSSGTLFRSHVGTAYKSPSLYELHSVYGDKNLSPERSFGWDIAWLQALLEDRASLELGYFENRFRDLIQFDLARFRYKNGGKALSKGIEAEFKSEVLDALHLNIFYTYTRTKNLTTGLAQLRHPRHQGRLELVWDYRRGGSLSGDLRYTGRREDIDAVDFSRKSLPSYMISNLWLRQKLKERFTLGARVENLFNKRYQEIDGYGTPGRAYFVSSEVLF